MNAKLLFVCLGNICRSPAAEAIMKKLIAEEGLESEVRVDSAGTYGGHAGELPDFRMRQIAGRRGYALTHRARKFTRSDFDRFDKIMVMDESNYEDVCRMAPDLAARQKVVPLAGFLRHHKDRFIPDPYYEGAEGFEYVVDLLEDGCRGLLNDLLKN